MTAHAHTHTHTLCSTLHNYTVSVQTFPVETSSGFLLPVFLCASQQARTSHFVSFLCLLREQFLKANAQVTFRCRQLLYELSYIYPVDVVSSGYKSSPAQHISNYRQMQRIIWCQTGTLITQKLYR